MGNTRRARPAKFPRQIVIMITHEMGDRLDIDSSTHDLSMSEVARTYLEAGIDAADALAADEAIATAARALNE